MQDGLVIGGKYRLKKLIGSGGMGQVWIACNEVTERDFAVKLLLPQAATNPEIVTRLVQEAKVSGRLRHRGILEIYDVGTAPELNGAPFLVMELLRGVSLEAALRPAGLPVRFTLLVAVAITRALRVAHDKGVIHRDLKPANVFLHRDEAGGIVPKLLDFGISKLAPLETSGADAMALTQTGAMLGSPRYMSPEQMAAQKDIDGRSDLHALGVLTWCCLVGRSPFGAPDFRTLLLEVLADPRPRLRDVRPDVPPGVSDFVSRAFARNRDHRYASAADALVVLEGELARLGPGPTLETHAWVDDVLGSADIPTQAVALGGFPRLPVDGKETTSHRAVSVSVKPPPDLPARAPSSTYGSAPGTPPGVPSRSARWLVLGVLGTLVTLALAGGAAILGRPPRPHERAATTESPVAPTGAVVTTAPTAAPPVVALAATADAGSTQPPAPMATAAHPAAPGGRPTKRATPAARPTTSGEPSNASDPFRGVTGTGL